MLRHFEIQTKVWLDVDWEQTTSLTFQRDGAKRKVGEWILWRFLPYFGLHFRIEEDLVEIRYARGKEGGYPAIVLFVISWHSE